MSDKKLVENMMHVRKRINTPRSLLDFSEGVIGDDKNSVNRNVEITQLVSDSRRVTNGSAFFALPGLRTDGNDMLKKLLIEEQERLLQRMIQLRSLLLLSKYA